MQKITWGRDIVTQTWHRFTLVVRGGGKHDAQDQAESLYGSNDVRPTIQFYSFTTTTTKSPFYLRWEFCLDSVLIMLTCGRICNRVLMIWKNTSHKQQYSGFTLLENVIAFQTRFVS